MKFFPIVLMIFLCSQCLLGQSILEPLQSVPAVVEHYAQTTEARLISLSQGDERSEACDALDQGFYSSGATVYAISGSSRPFCFQPSDFPFIDSLSCNNCDQLQAGSVVVDDAGFCIIYNANSGLTLDLSDTLSINVCQGNEGCENFLFPIVVRRANESQTLASQTIGTDFLLNLCLPSLNLPGNPASYNFLGCSDPELSVLGNADNCFNYLSQRFAGSDLVCIEVCDEYCVCDTYEFPINIEAGIMDLPFFDDFSYEGPYPDPVHWLNDHIFVNSSLSYEQPTVGVASFDGTSKTGRPYSGGYGASDNLTSAYLDLSGYGASDNVYLSYYLAPKGLGWSPSQQDSILLQFKAVDGEWKTIRKGTFQAIPHSVPEPFPTQPETIHIADTEYLYEGFQFRFINYSARNGMVDLWHLDYVRVDSDEIPDGTIEDVAFTELPSNLLNNFSTMPWSQFKGFQSTELATNYEVNVRNFFDQNFTLELTFFEVEELTTGTTFLSGNTLVNATTLSPFSQEVIPGNVPSFNLSDEFPASATNLEVEVAYDMEIGGEDIVDYPGIERNNTVRRIISFGNELGYDDGSAEFAVRYDNAGSQFAIELNLNTADDLQGFVLLMPRLGQAAGATFRVHVHQNSLQSAPIFTSAEYLTLFPEDSGLGPQKFAVYALRDEAGIPTPLPLNPGKYFIAVEKTTSSGRINVGLDRQNVQFQDKQHENISGSSDGWETLSHNGVFGFRAILGPEAPQPTAIHSTVESNGLAVFPNPATDEIHWNLADQKGKIEIFDLYGRNLITAENVGSLKTNSLPNGSYYFRFSPAKNGVPQVSIFQILR